MKRKVGKIQKMFLGKAVVFAICISIISGNFLLPVRAEEKASILQSILTEEGIDLYINGLGEYSDVTGQIGREPVEVERTGQDIEGHTIILLDNSLSVTKDNLAKVKDVLKKYAEIKKENEKVSLAVYGTDIQYLLEKEKEKDKIIETVESVASEDKDTYLTDVLYDELVKLGSKTEYTRFVIITDGVDNKEIGYTKEELSEYLKENLYPVYTIGCRYKSNEEELKNLFAISRLTNAKYYLLDDCEVLDEIAEGLCEPVAGIKIKVPDELRDGSIKNILLSFQSEAGTVEVAGELAVPFGLKEEGTQPGEAPETEEPEAAENPQPEEEPQPAEEPEPEKKQEREVPEQDGEKENPEAPEGEPAIDIVSIAAIAVIGIALIALLIVNGKKKGKNKGGNKKKSEPKKEVKGEKKAKEEKEEAESEEDKYSTVLVSEKGDETAFLDDKSKAGYIVALKDCADANKVFRYPLADKVVVGRIKAMGVDLVLNNNETVSAKHCEISVRSGHFYIKDLNSSNGTYLDGKRIPPNETWEFSSGSMLQMGNLKAIIEVDPIRR